MLRLGVQKTVDFLDREIIKKGKRNKDMKRERERAREREQERERERVERERQTDRQRIERARNEQGVCSQTSHSLVANLQ